MGRIGRIQAEGVAADHCRPRLRRIRPRGRHSSALGAQTSCTVAGLATPVEGCRSCVNGTQRGQRQKEVVRGQIAYAVKWSLVSAGLGIVVILLKLLLH